MIISKNAKKKFGIAKIVNRRKIGAKKALGALHFACYIEGVNKLELKNFDYAKRFFVR